MIQSKQVENYIITPQVLGEGTFGKVFLGYLKDDKAQMLAVKQIDLKNLKGDLRALKRELDLLNMLQGPNIVKFYKPLRTQNNLYFFLQHCSTDLKKYLKTKKQGYLSEAQALSFFRNICNGFKILQQKNVIHRDIKPANILLKNGVAKITDFGFARIVEDVDEEVKHTFLGSPLYMSPQILSKTKFSAKCDVWSLGMTVYEMLYGRTPWTGNNIQALLENILTRKLDFPANIARSEKVKELLTKMLAIKEEDRISWNDIFLHELVGGAESKEIKKKLHEVQVSQLEDLEKSFTMNQIYISNNKVLDQGHNMEGLEESELSRKASEKEKIVGGYDYEGDIKYQQQRQKEQQIIEKVDGYIRYRRNVLVYENISTNTFFSKGKALIPQSLFFMGMFQLQKFQVVGYQNLLDIFSGKRQLQRYSEVDWKLYKTSNSYWSTLKALKSDDRYLRPYFKEVYLKSLKYFQNNPIELEFRELYQRFKHEHNDDVFKHDFKVHEQVLSEIISLLEKQKADQKLITALKICQNPYVKLPEETDFYRLYEQEQHQ